MEAAWWLKVDSIVCLVCRQLPFPLAVGGFFYVIATALITPQ
jgi:hypothetical protein